MKISKASFFLIIAFLAWFPPLYLSNKITLLLRIFVLIYLLNGIKVKQLFRDTFFNILGIFTLIRLISIFANINNINEIWWNISSLTIFPTIYLAVNSHKIEKKYVNTVLICSLTYFSLDAFWALFTENGTGINDNFQPLYFSGGKFQICYIYIILLAFLMIKKKLSIKTKIFLLLFGLFIAYHVDCNTGAVAIFSFGVILFIPRIFYRKKVVYFWLTSLILVNYLLVIVQIQNTNLLLRHIITEILHRDISMTGRTVIYNSISEIMSGHWILGYGIGNSYIVEYTGLANMQNGFLQILYTSGVLGLIAYMILLIIMFKRIEFIFNNEAKIVILGAISSFLIIAIVEIPLTAGYMMLLYGLIHIYSNRSNEIVTSFFNNKS